MEFPMMMSFLKTVVLSLVVSQVFADAKMLEQAQVKSFIQEMVVHHHFTTAEVQKILANAEYKPIIIEKMNSPYEAKPWDVYQQLFLTPGRIQAGQDFWKAHAKTLSLAEKKYGVPANIIVAILGVETIYGQRQGDFRVLDALSTLAFYFPKRAAYFRYELSNYLLMCRENHLNPNAQLGSYAGAMGQGQFMPSSYRRFAVKFQGEGAPDLMHNSDDAIFSVGNYLNKHGWHYNQKIAQIARKKENFCDDLAFNAKKATYAYRELQKCGFSPVDAAWSHPDHAGVLQMQTSKGHEYWIAYPNFYVILTYNSSPLYGLAVYLLGQSIQANVG